MRLELRSVDRAFGGLRVRKRARAKPVEPPKGNFVFVVGFPQRDVRLPNELVEALLGSSAARGNMGVNRWNVDGSA